jgi:hypothetical protein
MKPGTVALEIGAVATLWVLLFELNGWLFAGWETSELANWVFLPAALRLVAVLIVGWRGACGLFLGALVTNWLMQTPWPSALALSALSALGPVLAVKLARDWLRWPTDLAGLRFSHLLLLAALGAACNGLLHHAYLAWTAPDANWMPQLFTMVSGDLVGTLAVMLTASLVLRRIAPPH